MPDWECRVEGGQEIHRSGDAEAWRSRDGAWSWHCLVCGWLGLGLFTVEGARREAERHTVEHHGHHSG